MRRSNLLPGSCLLAAERIDFLLGRDRDHLFPHFFSKVSCGDRLANKCGLVKVPKVPSQVEQLPLYGFQMRKFPVKKKLDGARKERIDLSIKEKGTSTSQINRSARHTQCCMNQKTPYLHFETDSSAVNDLTAVRVIDWRFKEHFLVSRRLRKLHKGQKPVEKHHNFFPITPQKKKQDSLKDQEFWEEMISMQNRRTPL